MPITLKSTTTLPVLYLVTTRYPEAIRHLKRLVELQPDNQNARQLLKFAHLKAQETAP